MGFEWTLMDVSWILMGIYLNSVYIYTHYIILLLLLLLLLLKIIVFFTTYHSDIYIIITNYYC
jgi:hypothetical protein